MFRFDPFERNIEPNRLNSNRTSNSLYFKNINDYYWLNYVFMTVRNSTDSRVIAMMSLSVSTDLDQSASVSSVVVKLDAINEDIASASIPQNHHQASPDCPAGSILRMSYRALCILIMPYVFTAILFSQ